MKKILFCAAAAAMMMFAACGNKTDNANGNADSTAADTAVVEAEPVNDVFANADAVAAKVDKGEELNDDDICAIFAFMTTLYEEVNQADKTGAEKEAAIKELYKDSRYANAEKLEQACEKWGEGKEPSEKVREAMRTCMKAMAEGME